MLKGLHRPEQLPEGRGGRGACRTSQERRRVEAAAARTATSSGPNNFFPRDAVARHRGAADCQRRHPGDCPRISASPLVCTNDVHYLRDADAHPHDILLCIGTGKAFSDPEAPALRQQAVLPEDGRRDGGASSATIPDALANTVRIADRCDVELARGRELPAQLRRAARLHARRATSSTSRARASGAPAAAAAAGRDRRAAPHDRRVRAPAVLRNRR